LPVPKVPAQQRKRRFKSSAPDTIVPIHGFRVTPRSWENWVAHDERRGYRVLAPAYPGFDVEGMPVTPLSRIKSTFPVLRHPASRHKAVSYDLEQSDHAFASTSDEDEARWPYGRYAVPVSGRIRSRCAP
jgi:hypothetical protein